MPISDWLSDRSAVFPKLNSNVLANLQGAVSGGVQDALHTPMFGTFEGDDSAPGGASVGAVQSDGTRSLVGSGKGGLGSTLDTVGSLAGKVAGVGGLGLAGNIAGTAYDQIQANQKLERVGLPDLTFQDYLGSVTRNALPDFLGNAFGIRSTDDRMFDAMHGLGYSDYVNAEDPSYGYGWGQVDQFGQPTYGNAPAAEVYGPANGSTYVDSLGNPWGGPDGSGLGATGGTADDEGGGWSGGSSESDLDSGGDW